MGDAQEKKPQKTKQKKKLSAAWSTFAANLTAVLSSLKEDEIVILAKKNSPQDIIQFVSEGSWGLRAEVVSNFFREENQLSEDLIATLLTLGWNVPSGSDEESTPELDPDGSPNYFKDFQVPLERSSIAFLAVSTLVEVFGIGHPSRLEYESFDGEGNSLAQPKLGLKPLIEPDETDHLRDNLLPIVQELTGIADLGYDPDGDISNIKYGSTVTYLRLLDDRPYLRCFSLLIMELEESPALLARLNQLNIDHGHMHLYVKNGGVVAISDVLVAPLVTSHLAYAIGNFTQVADEMCLILSQEFGKEACSFSNSTEVRH